ncbi:MAG: hypothetical protein JNK27_15255 [Chitinophagaceae bacterium]|nr:hypothetical protein [Chitinophagaceae bacterium]
MKGRMPEFIAVLYGTVLGVSFFKASERLFGSTGILAKVRDAYLLEHNKQEPGIFNMLINREVLFDFFFFLVTILIVAHDWWAYHSSFQDNKKKPFVSYIPQMIGLIFIAQMFNTSTKELIRYWYAFGLLYTACNIFNYLVDMKAFKKGFLSRVGDYPARGSAYIVHIGIIAAFIYLAPEKPDTLTCFFWVIATIFLVAIFWLLKWKFDKKDTNTISADFEISGTADLENVKEYLPLEINNIQLNPSAEIIKNLKILERIKMQGDNAVNDDVVKENMPYYNEVKSNPDSAIKGLLKSLMD